MYTNRGITIRSQPYGNKFSLHNEERYQKHPEGGYLVFRDILYIFFAPFKAFIGGGGQIDIRLREFQGLFLLIQGVVIKRLALRFKKMFILIIFCRVRVESNFH